MGMYPWLRGIPTVFTGNFYFIIQCGRSSEVHCWNLALLALAAKTQLGGPPPPPPLPPPLVRVAEAPPTPGDHLHEMPVYKYTILSLEKC